MLLNEVFDAFDFLRTEFFELVLLASMRKSFFLRVMTAASVVLEAAHRPRGKLGHAVIFGT